MWWRRSEARLNLNYNMQFKLEFRGLRWTTCSSELVREHAVQAAALFRSA